MPKSTLLEQACDTIVDLQSKLKTSASIISNFHLGNNAVSSAAPLLTSPTVGPSPGCPPSKDRIAVGDAPMNSLPVKRARLANDQEALSYGGPHSTPSDLGYENSNQPHDGANLQCRCHFTTASTSSSSTCRSSNSPEPSGTTSPYIRHEVAVELQRALASLLTTLPAHTQKPKRRCSTTNAYAHQGHPRSHSSNSTVPATSTMRCHSHWGGKEHLLQQSVGHEDGYASTSTAPSNGPARSCSGAYNGRDSGTNVSSASSVPQQQTMGFPIKGGTDSPSNEAAIARFMQALPTFQF